MLYRIVSFVLSALIYIEDNRTLTHIHSEKDVVCNLTSVEKILLQHCLVPNLVDQAHEESFKVSEVLLFSQTSLENFWVFHVKNKRFLNSKGASLNQGIAIVEPANSFWLRTKSPESDIMMSNVVMQI